LLLKLRDWNVPRVLKPKYATHVKLVMYRNQ